jgi:hypothetical protein
MNNNKTIIGEPPQQLPDDTVPSDVVETGDHTPDSVITRDDDVPDTIIDLSAATLAMQRGISAASTSSSIDTIGDIISAVRSAGGIDDNYALRILASMRSGQFLMAVFTPTGDGSDIVVTTFGSAFVSKDWIDIISQMNTRGQFVSRSMTERAYNLWS